jgi:hypothetical protein
MITIDILMARDLKEEPATKQELKEVVKYYRWLRAQSEAGEKPPKDDLPKKDAKKFLEERGVLRKQPQEEERRA